MYKSIFLLLFLLNAPILYAQKKPLDHSVYDIWQSIGSKKISSNGLWAAYQINLQEGDGTLYFQETTGKRKIGIPRGAAVQFSNDAKFAAFYIKPLFQEVRQAKIKKKKSAEMPKDSLGIIDLSSLTIIKIARVKSFKFAEKGGSEIAYSLEKPIDTAKKADTAKKDSSMDTLTEEGKKEKTNQEGTELYFKNLFTGTAHHYKFVSNYHFSKDGKLLIFTCTGSKKDKNAPVGTYLLNTEKDILKTLVKEKGTFKNFVFDEDSEHVAFLGETDPDKQEIKNYRIYFNSLSLDTAQILVDNEVDGIPANYGISSNATLMFSKNGEKLFFGIAQIKQPKDTTLVDFEHAKVDIWSYRDDYLQPMQLKNLDKDLKKSYLSVIDIYNANPKVIQLADEKIPDVLPMSNGNAPFALASTDKGSRIQTQWTGNPIKDYYLVNTQTGKKQKIIENLTGNVSASPDGNYVLYFNKKDGNWYTYAVTSGKTTQLNAGIQVQFTDEENDLPDKPESYGYAGWIENDKAVLIYDKYDIWAFSPDGSLPPRNITMGFGRNNQLTFRILKLNPDFSSFNASEQVVLKTFDNNTKESGFSHKTLSTLRSPEILIMDRASFPSLIKASNANVYLYEKESYTESPNIYFSSDLKTATKLSETNLQQANYNWGTAELRKWTTQNGHPSQGILYKPQDFDPSKKYPMIVYFYEKLSNGLYDYIPPAPTPSRLNISYFVSNGYLVFAPDITYTIGHPGESAAEYINSGVYELRKNQWVNGQKIGIQGQSWGGYQVAYLITVTDMYAAAWTGAPVVNMTSAYGGIRWGSGINRQFQYEKTQSRIGATLWEKPNLYIENSPLFYLPRVKTPVAIMSNDGDGAVPWYQGIEMFTALKRLGKPAWLLNYNNEAHNLMQRQNRKDIQIREQQFFDHYLKDAKAPVWMTRGVPATEKGKNWGFELTDEKP